jgi:hypothetical protein
LLTALTCAATNRTWSGTSGIDNNWMTPGNWQGGVAPSPGDNLSFPGVLSGGNLTNNNDFPDGTIFGTISIATAKSQDYAIGGNRIVLTNGITEGSSGFGAGGAFVFFNITLSSNQTFTASGGLTLNNTIDTAGNEIIFNNTGNVTVNGTLTNSIGNEINGVSLVKTNTGTLTISSTGILAGTASYEFDSRLDEGTLVMDSQGDLVNQGANFYIDQGSLVVDGSAEEVIPQGSGGSISGTGLIIDLFQYLGGSATITPGDNGAPGVLRCYSVIVEDPGSLKGPDTLQIIINGPAYGTGYGALVVDNSFDFAPSSAAPFGSPPTELELQWNYTPQIGDSFRVVAQVPNPWGYSPITNGFFYGLPPNSILDATNGATLGVVYNTNGVTLTTLRTTNSPFAVWKGSVAADFSAYESRNWSSTNNWAQGAGPASGDVLIFGPYQLSCYTFTTNLTLIPIPPAVTNDLASGLSLAGLLFSGTNYTLYGNALTLTGGITNSAPGGTNSCYLDIAFAGALPLDVESGGSLLMDGVISGSGTINKTGAGTLIYTGTTPDAFFGTVAVNNGTLEVDGYFTDGSFTVNGGILDGIGTVSAVTMTGGTLKPGDSPGILHVEGNLTMAPGAAFEAELDGPVPDSGYDQLQVNGSINLNGATLNLHPNFTASVGSTFLILVNQGTSPISGTFAGLPEGAIFEAGGQYFSISYQAGSGNKNVVVTRVNPPANLTRILSVPPTTVELLGAGGSNATYTILANTNLATTNWLEIGTALANGSGSFLFYDSNVLSYPQRFYKIQSP